MNSDQVERIVQALRSISSSLTAVAFAIIMAGLWNMCGALNHH